MRASGVSYERASSLSFRVKIAKKNIHLKKSFKAEFEFETLTTIENQAI